MNAYSIENDFMSITDTDKVAVHMGDGWCTFPDLDNFDSHKLLRALCLKEKDSSDSIWDPSLSYSEAIQRKGLSVSALRQLEALFNLSQLLFGLSRAETVNYTFRDLQLRKCPHSFKKSGFKMLAHAEGRIDFYAIFERLVHEIIAEGGLEITLLIYKNPILPMVRQKCLDLVSNLATVPSVASHVMKHQSWFLDHLLIMVRDGDIVSDKIPALSVLIRLLKVMLTDRMESSYMKLVDMQYIDCIVDIFEHSKYNDPNFVPFFIKFEFITMQSLTVILGDTQFCQFWSDKAKIRLLNYCMVVLLKAVGALSEANETINHIFYAEQHTNKHSLAHTIMTVTELLRNDEKMKSFYRYHKPFKQLIIKLIEKYGAKSKYIRTDPGISYALNHLMRVLYIKSVLSVPSKATTSTKSIKRRLCSYAQCGNEETKYKSFKECKYCSSHAYCSRECRKLHSAEHMRVCDFKKNHERREPEEVLYENAREQRRISDYVANRRNTLQAPSVPQPPAQTLTHAKKLSKYTSNVDKTRVDIDAPKYSKSVTKTTRSFKETKQGVVSRRHSTEPSFNQDNQSIQFVRPLKTSTAVCLPDLKSTSSSASSGGSGGSNSRRQSSSGITKAHESSNKGYYTSKETEMFFYHEKQQAQNSQESEDEDNNHDGRGSEDEHSLNTSTSSLDSTVSASSFKANAHDKDEEEKKELFDFFKKHQQKPHKKVLACDEVEIERKQKSHHQEAVFNDTEGDIDEQERRSQLKVMKEFEKTLNFVSSATSNSSNASDNDNGLRAPHMSLATLCYDSQTTNKENSGGCDETCDITLQSDATLVKSEQHGNKIVINNSVNSNLLLNSFASETPQVTSQKRVCHPINEDDDEIEAKKFKKPLSSYLPLSLAPVVKRDSLKQKTSTLKDMTINATLSVEGAPIESTPIYDIGESATNTRRKNLQAQLELNTTSRNTGEVLMTLAKRQITKTLVKESKDSGSSQLNLSQYAALTNAEATDSFIAIAKTELPKDLKKSLKDDVKREKKNCILQ